MSSHVSDVEPAACLGDEQRAYRIMEKALEEIREFREETVTMEILSKSIDRRQRNKEYPKQIGNEGSCYVYAGDVPSCPPS